MNVVTSNDPSLSVKPQTRRIGNDMQGKEKINRPSQGFEALPYLQGLTEEIEENICKTQCLGPSYTICNASIDSIRPKDPLDPSEKYAVVYKVASKECDQAYVAETE